MRQRTRTRKRETKQESSQTLTMEADDLEEEDHSKKGFFACYLLVSLSPRHKGHTYIGFTVNPRRRIRQHNGEIGCGAWRTKKRRPWEMVLCIHGFPSNVSALQFEWAWQHPYESVAVRNAAASFKTMSGIGNKIKLAYTMLTLPSWQSLNMTVNYFSTKYTKHSAGCPSLPGHMKVRISPMDELPCYFTGQRDSLMEHESEWGDEEEASKSSEGSSSNSGFEILKERDKSSGDDETSNDDDLWLSSYQFAERPTSPNVETREWSTAPISLDDEDTPRERLRVVVPEEIEVIDVTTPSPRCGTSLLGKKRRVSSICPEVIDLTTTSPSFVQL